MCAVIGNPNRSMAIQSSIFLLEQMAPDVHACDDFFQQTLIAPLNSVYLMPEFRNAFGCEEGDNLKPVGEEITIW